MTLVSLEQKRRTPDEEVIKFVRAVLRRAESGQLRAVAFVEVFLDDTIACGHVNKRHLNTLTGGAARLLHQLVSVVDDYASDDADGPADSD